MMSAPVPTSQSNTSQSEQREWPEMTKSLEEMKEHACLDSLKGFRWETQGQFPIHVLLYSTRFCVSSFFFFLSISEIPTASQFNAIQIRFKFHCLLP